MRVFVWGAGRCGRALANAVHHAGHEVVGTWNRTETTAHAAGKTPWPRFWGARPDAVDDAELVWLTVSDGAIEDAAAVALRPHHLALHAAGAVPADRLRVTAQTPVSVAACHPLQSFATPMAGPEHVRGVTFGIQGETAAVQAAEQLVAAMGADSFVVADETAKTLYHAACCVASNAMVALADQAVTLFHAAGVPRADALKALAPLIRGTAANLSATDEARRVLTGPIARGDTAVVQRHHEAIAERVPGELANYKALCAAIEKMLG